MIDVKSTELPRIRNAVRTAAKTVKQQIAERQLWASLFAAMLLLTVTGAVMLQMRAVTVFDGEQQIHVRTLKQTVGEVLTREGVVLDEKDEVSPALGMRLQREDSIVIHRAFDVALTNGTEPLTVRTTEKVLSDVLAENGIELGELDVVNPSLDTIVTAETQINITRIAQNAVAEYYEIPYKTVRRPNSAMERGTNNTVQQGVKGQKEVVYNVTTQNGAETARELVGERIVAEAVNEIVEYGTKSPMRQLETLTSRSGSHASSDGFSYNRAITCNASAYDLSYASCGKRPGDRGYGVTASGMKAAPGVVAVDPRVIPLGTRLYIASNDGSADYGYAVAGDTGGAIKGNRVDLFFSSHAQAIQFGRRSVTVYVLD